MTENTQPIDIVTDPHADDTPNPDEGLRADKPLPRDKG